MEQFFEKSLYSSENINVTTLSALLAIGIVVIAVFLSWLLRRYIIKTKSAEGVVPEFAKRLFMIVSLIIWVLAAIVVIIVLDVPFKTVLEEPVIDTKNFNLKPIHFFLAALVIIGTRIIIMALEKLIVKDKMISSDDVNRRKNVFKVITYVIWVAAFLIILNFTGLKLTVLWGAGAALLVGIGFGLQQIFADLISGLFLLFEGNLKEDDVVEMANGTVGKVTFIGARTSKIKTRDNVVLIIPNSHFITEEVINWSHIENQTRFQVSVGVAYGSDVQLVKKILLECADDNRDISSRPKPFVRFQDFGESSLDFSLYFWTSRSFEVENIKSDIRFTIEEKFRENKVQIPFPQRDVHIKK